MRMYPTRTTVTSSTLSDDAKIRTIRNCLRLSRLETELCAFNLRFGRACMTQPVAQLRELCSGPKGLAGDCPARTKRGSNIKLRKNAGRMGGWGSRPAYEQRCYAPYGEQRRGLWREQAMLPRLWAASRLVAFLRERFAAYSDSQLSSPIACWKCSVHGHAALMRKRSAGCACGRRLPGLCQRSRTTQSCRLLQATWPVCLALRPTSTTVGEVLFLPTISEVEKISITYRNAPRVG